FVDDPSGARRESVAAEERTVVVAGEEARLLTLAAARDGESCGGGLRAGLVLALVAEREPDAVEVPRIDLREHVRLVLLGIGGAPSAWPASRATTTAAGEQQARCASGPAGSSHSRSVTPTAFGRARRSATALSTPPLIATAVRPGRGSARKTGPSAFASASAA